MTTKPTHIMLIGLALVALMLLVCSVGAVPYRDYDMTYSETTHDADATGYLYIQVLTFESTYSNTVILQRVDPAGAPAVTNGIVSKDIFNLYAPIGESKTLKLSPTAAYDISLVPGVYRLELTDGNNERPEYAVVQIASGQKTEVHFQGHAVSRWNEKKPVIADDSGLVIISALYGAAVTVEDSPGTSAVTHTEYRYIIHPAIPAVAEVDSQWVVCVPHGKTVVATRTVTDIAAYTDWHGHYHPAVTHNEYKYMISPAIPAVAEQDSGWVTSVPAGKTVIETRVVIDTPEVPAVTGSTEDHYTDVTAIVQGLVTNNELHITADYPNLHYNALFGDPCVGTAKTLKVEYALNGVPGSVSVDEMTDISIP